MTEPGPRTELVETLQRGGSHGGGNELYLYRLAGALRILKVYRRRGGWAREFVRDLSHRLVEGKRGVSARSRHRTERESLTLWRRSGFRVPAIYDAPLPREVRPAPYLWLEYCPGRPLADILEDSAIAVAHKGSLLNRLAGVVGARQRLALDNGEPLLVPEHASTKHVIVSPAAESTPEEAIAAEAHLVHFDLEGGYGPRMHLLEALAQELSGILRSIARKAEEDRERLVGAFVAGYPHRDLLHSIARYGTSAGTWHRRFKRRFDVRRRPFYSKTEMLRGVLEILDGAGAARGGAPTAREIPTPSESASRSQSAFEP